MLLPASSLNLSLMLANLFSRIKMFNFIKKAGTGVTLDKEDRERKKRDKKERKEKQKRERSSMSTDELLRLDEVWLYVV